MRLVKCCLVVSRIKSKKSVLKFLEEDIQVILLSSATVPEDVLDVSTHFVRNPVRILMRKEKLTLEGIKQLLYIDVGEEEWRFDTLRDFYMTLLVNTLLSCYRDNTSLLKNLRLAQRPNELFKCFVVRNRRSVQYDFHNTRNG